MTLKIATKEDQDAIRQMVLDFALNSPYADIHIDVDKINEVISNILEEDNSRSIILLGCKDDQIVGMIIASTSEMLINRDIVAQELVYWIDPEHRGGRLAIQMLDAFEYWAIKVGAKFIQMSLVATELAPKVSAIYKRKGYRPCETGFLKKAY